MPHGQAGGKCILDGPCHQNPVRPRVVSSQSVVTGTRLKFEIGARIPFAVAAKGKATIMILEDLEGTGGGRFLLAHDVDQVGVVVPMGSDVPGLSEDGCWWVAGESLLVLELHGEFRENRPARYPINFQVFDVSRVAMLIPEINLLALVFCIDPSAENSMLMGVVRWEIVGHDTPTRCHQRMNESTALIKRRNAFGMCEDLMVIGQDRVVA